jgi:hypothetical protein
VTTALACDRAGAGVGYVMPRVAGASLHAIGEPRYQRTNAGVVPHLVPALLALHDAIAALHRARIVIGDCNDLNVLVDGPRVHLIDVDSYQFGGFACPMFSERFVDPRLCPPTQLVPSAPHDEASDWFAFAAMAFRTLLGVGPYGGVARSCPPSARALRRHSVLAADVTYPRTARSPSILPDELVATFRDWFEGDRRGVFPRAALERLHLAPCAQCGEPHARAVCPACRTRTHVPPASIGGRLRWHAIAPSDVALDHEVGAPTPVWLDGETLFRAGRLGPERIGSVLADQTRAWCGARLGVGFYRAGGYTVGFVFHPARGRLDDRVALPRIRGRLIAAHATLGETTAWLWLTTVDGGRVVTTAIVIDSSARVLAVDDVTAAPWHAGIPGACAAGAHLFVPTDDGVARVELQQRVLVQTRTFPETAALISAGDRLALHPGGIDAVRADDAIRLTLT